MSRAAAPDVPLQAASYEQSRRAGADQQQRRRLRRRQRRFRREVVGDAVGEEQRAVRVGERTPEMRRRDTVTGELREEDRQAPLRRATLEAFVIDKLSAE